MSSDKESSDGISMPDYSQVALSDLFMDQAILVNCSFASVAKRLEQSVKTGTSNHAEADIFLRLMEALEKDGRYRRFKIWLKRHASEQLRSILDIN